MEQLSAPKPLRPRPMWQNPWLPLAVVIAAALLASGCNLSEWVESMWRPLPGI